MEDPTDAEVSASGVETVSERLTRQAATGDREAAGRFFAENLPLFSGLAHQIAGSAYDPADLLSETMLKVLELWSAGGGPTENAIAYVAQSMRNRMKDVLKSPQSRNQSLEPEAEIVEPPSPLLRRIEIQDDLAIVRRALERLPDDQRLVLIATIVDGRKSGDLEQELDRPASAIYSLLRRAKTGLRRAALRVLLEERAPEDCRKAASHLPEHVPDTPEELRRTKWTEHYEECDRCRKAWARFAGLAALGVLPVLVITQTISAPAAPAQADGADAASEPDSSESSAPVPSSASPARTSSSAPAGPTSPGGQVVAASTPTAPSTRIASSLGTLLRSRGFGVGTFCLLAAGSLVLGIVGVAFLTHTLWFAPRPAAELHVASAWSGDRLHLDVRFAVQDHSWKADRMEISLSAPITSVDPPSGWICDENGTSAHCTTPQIDPRGGELTIKTESRPGELSYRLSISATADSGHLVEGTASGELEITAP